MSVPFAFTGTRMNELALQITNSKRRGEWAELRFMAAAAQNGLRITKPWGDSAQYDFIVEYEARYLRIQVKSTTFMNHNGYSCTMRPSRRGVYGDDPFDFVAAYVIPEDMWFIIPEHIMRGRLAVALRPGRKDLKYGPYMEAWDLLKEK
jgi:hypothetical protein